MLSLYYISSIYITTPAKVGNASAHSVVKNPSPLLSIHCFHINHIAEFNFSILYIFIGIVYLHGIGIDNFHFGIDAVCYGIV